MLVQNDKQADYLLKRLSNAQIISIDTETVSLEDKTIVAFSIAVDEVEAYVIPVAMNYITNLPKYKVKELLEAACYCDGTVYHNYSFDGQVLYPMLCRLMDYEPHDTMIISQLLDENSKHGLKFLAKKYLGYTMMTFKEVCGTGKNQISFADVSDPAIVDKYAGDDALCTLKLYKMLKAELNLIQEVEECYSEIERPLLNVVLDMHLTGVPIDVNKVLAVASECKKHTKKLEQRLQKMKVTTYDNKRKRPVTKTVNINSTKQLRQYFIEKNNMPVLKQTPKGEPSVDKEVLKKYADDCQEAKDILEYRKYSKILSTFIPAMTPEYSTRIFPTFRQVGTTSGRFSSANPNFQNIPKSKDDALNLRKCVKASHGQVFIGADYSQMELRLAAHYSGDHAAIKAYNDGIDMHDITMKATGLDRTPAKVVNFGILYGMSAKTLAKNINSSIDEASEFMNQFFTTYPDILKFMQDIRDEVMTTGFITLYGGRHRRLSQQFPYKERFQQEGELRSIGNAIIQGSGAMIIKKAMVLMHKKLQKYGAKIVAQVHDELLIECPELYAEDVKKIVADCMVKPTKGLKVPFTVDVKVGKTWGDAH